MIEPWFSAAATAVATTPTAVASPAPPTLIAAVDPGRPPPALMRPVLAMAAATATRVRLPPHAPSRSSTAQPSDPSEATPDLKVVATATTRAARADELPPGTRAFAPARTTGEEERGPAAAILTGHATSRRLAQAVTRREGGDGRRGGGARFCRPRRSTRERPERVVFFLPYKSQLMEILLTHVYTHVLPSLTRNTRVRGYLYTHDPPYQEMILGSISGTVVGTSSRPSRWVALGHYCLIGTTKSKSFLWYSCCGFAC
jgi:hypothetical protein